MPIYEYKCSDCESNYEIFHKSLSNLSEIKCPKCQSVNYSKRLSVVNANVQGSPSKFFNDMPSCASGNCGINSGACGSGMCGMG